MTVYLYINSVILWTGLHNGSLLSYKYIDCEYGSLRSLLSWKIKKKEEY